MKGLSLHTFLQVPTTCSLLFVVLRLLVKSYFSLVLTVLQCVRSLHKGKHSCLGKPFVGPQELRAKECEHFSGFHLCYLRGG